MARVDQYVDALETANEELISFAESCSDEQWLTLVPGEDWSVGVLVHHCAIGHDAGVAWMREMFEQGEVPITPEELDAVNASHAVDFADVGRTETVALLRRTGTAAADYLRTLSDEDLDREAAFGPAGGAVLTVERFTGAFSRHPRGHLSNAHKALAGE